MEGDTVAKFLVYVLVAFASAPAYALECFDCECNRDGIWEAWDAEATGHWSNGRSEPGINVRRCGELNRGATGGVCRAGQHQNIYTSPAPAITSPRCVFGPGPDDGDGDGGDGDNTGDGVDRFSQVKALFDATDATLPTVEELSAYWTGRCYRETNRSVAKGGVLFARRHGGDDGPLFPGDGEPKLYIFEHTDNASAFDDLSSDELDSINDLITGYNDVVTTATTTGGYLSSYYLPEGETPIVWKAKKVIRDGRTYYASTASLARASGGRPQGFTFMACYHYAQSRMPTP